MIPWCAVRQTLALNRPLTSNVLEQSVTGVVTSQRCRYTCNARKQKHPYISSFARARRTDSFRQACAAVLIGVSIVGVLAAKGDWNLRLSFDINGLDVFSLNRPLRDNAVSQRTT
jgi:hypothetical protein